MSAFALLTVVGFSVLSLWGVVLGLRGCQADAPPFMQGEGARGRFDARMGRAA